MNSFSNKKTFQDRHIGIDKDVLEEMYEIIGVESCERLMSETIPDDIRINEPLDLPEPMSEYKWLSHARDLASKNKQFKSFIGQGYYDTITPSVILRNVFENPGWYTQYTPYQAEISQGRLEALLNFQTMVADLTGMPLANASLLDEATAAAEAMAMMYEIHNKKRKKDPANVLFVDEKIFRQTKDVLETRANPKGIVIKYGDWKQFVADDHTFGFIVQYPNSEGAVNDYKALVQQAADKNILSSFIADLLSLTLLTPPGEWDADIVVGSTQRFGVPMGFGGPHAAYFATRDEFKRQIPGRIIGVSKDSHGNTAYRMALQTREQHIKREKATSNICTAQALLAIMAGMYAIYHGKEGLKNIAMEIHEKAVALYDILRKLGYTVRHDQFFDTLFIEADVNTLQKIKTKALTERVNLWYTNEGISINFGESCCDDDLKILADIFAFGLDKLPETGLTSNGRDFHYHFDQELVRKSEYLSYPVFNEYKTETSLMRYIKQLENKDLSLVHSMIPLGSCTMKLNAASELIPVSWPEFANIHPFVPFDQATGYLELFENLEKYLCEITGFSACTLQPNSGAQGEYTGLMAIRGYHESRNDLHRNIVLVPASAHGTNPASAMMAGMDLKIVACDDQGNIDVDDLKQLLGEYGEHLAGLMVTYPSTHGVFETSIRQVCDLIHEHGGMVYLDGANMNAQIGFTNPAKIGADVCHLNLHKTFAIPHGGGGPGVGPVLCIDKLAPFLPGHFQLEDQSNTKAVASAPWGSANILLISYGYIRMMGAEGLKRATQVAILNANYIYKRLENAYKILYTGAKDRVAHEFILDLNPFKSLEITAEDVAKRLMDYGFHAPTLAFPVAGTLMVEPTESEDKKELDRFCDALLSIKKEIDEVASGQADQSNNVLKNSPHPISVITADEFDYPYSRQKAAYPVPSLHQNKFWPAVGRIDNAYGDRNLFCSCVPISELMEMQ
jgi:glycine dehydrogenase